MGTSNFFKRGAQPSPIRLSEPNMMARSIAAPGYASTRDAGIAAKDLGAAAAINKAGRGHAIFKSAPSAAPGPKV